MEQSSESNLSGNGDAVSERPGSGLLFGVPKEVVAVSVARFCDAFGNSILFVVMPLYFEEFQLATLNLAPELLVGILIALFPFVSSMAQPFVGWFSDRFGNYKAITLVGLALTAASTYAFVHASNFWDLVLFRAIQGFGVALTIPTSLALISLHSTFRNRGVSMSFFVASRTLGLGLGPLVGGLMAISVGFTWSFIASAALIAIGFLMVMAMIKEPKKPEMLSSTPETPPGFLAIFRKKGFATLALTSIMLAASINLLPALEIQVNDRLGQTAAEFGLALSVLLLSNLIFQFFSGRLSDRFGRKVVITSGLLVLAPATAIIGVADSTAFLLVVMVFQGMATAFIGSPAYALAGDMSSRGSVAKRMSVLTASFGLGLSIGPLAAGFLAGYFRYEAPFLFIGLLVFLCGLLVIFRVSNVRTGSAYNE